MNLKKLVFVFSWVNLAFAAPEVTKVEIAENSHTLIIKMQLGCGSGSAVGSFCQYTIKKLWTDRANPAYRVVQFGTAVCAVRENGKCPSVQACAYEDTKILNDSIAGTLSDTVGEVDHTNAPPATPKTNQTAGSERRSKVEPVNAGLGHVGIAGTPLSLPAKR